MIDVIVIKAGIMYYMSLYYLLNQFYVKKDLNYVCNNKYCNIIYYLVLGIWYLVFVFWYLCFGIYFWVFIFGIYFWYLCFGYLCVWYLFLGICVLSICVLGIYFW